MRCWTRAFLSKAVRIRAVRPDAARILDQLLSTLPETDAETASEFLLESSAAGWILQRPDRFRQSVGSPFDAFDVIESFVYDRLLPDTRDCLVLHSAALLPLGTDSVVLLAGPSHCGKSTLSLALVASGGFAYLSEEAVGVDLDGHAIPYPKPFRIRFGAERLVAGKPGWRIAGSSRKGIQYVVPPRNLLAPQDSRPRIRYAIFPEFVPGIRCSSRRMSRAEGIAWLANCSTNHPDFLASHLSRLSELWQEASAWRLWWSQPEEAAEFVRGLVEEDQPPDPVRARESSSIRRSVT